MTLPAPPPFAFGLEAPEDAMSVAALVARAFGPGRYAKTAERLREGAELRRDLGAVARRGGEVVGAVRLWRARIGADPVVFLGPIAVEAELRGHGLGATLVERACEAARDTGERAVVLVGDMGFFGPLGFQPVPEGRVVPQGPVDLRRLLWRGLGAGALDGLEGELKGALD